MGLPWETPVTLGVITLLVAVRIRTAYFQDAYNPMHAYFNYENFLHRKQYWRLISSVVSHDSWYHMCLNIVVLWAYRFVEARLGSIFYLGYTLLLVTLNRWIAVIVGHIDSSNRIRGYFLSSLGYSDVIIAWSCYVAVDNYRSAVYLFDVLPVSSYVMVLVLLNASLLFTSVVNRPLVCYISLLTGAVLGCGIDLLPTAYWAYTFIFDVTLVLIWSLFAFPVSQQGDNNDIESNVDQALEDALRRSRQSMLVEAGQGAPVSGALEQDMNNSFNGDENV